jgi:hypothetical protein
MLHHLVNALKRQQLRPRSWMALLAAPLAATASAAFRRLKTLAVTGGWFGRVARRSADPLAQGGEFRRQGGELRSELFVLLAQHLNLLLLMQDQ